MCEFCWVACHLYMLYLILALVSASRSDISLVHNKVWFYLYWGLANGPFAFSVILFKNAIVLHDLPNMSSTFIHLTPCSATWTMRWFANKVLKRWPGVFDLPNPDLPVTETFADIFVPTCIFYFGWWSLYFVWVFFHGRYQGLPQSKYDTLFHWGLSSNKTLAKLCNYDPSNTSQMLPIFKFMCIHAAFFNISICWSYVMWLEFHVHTLFCLFLFGSATWMGAIRYYNMMTKYYLKSLEKVLKSL